MNDTCARFHYHFVLCASVQFDSIGGWVCGVRVAEYYILFNHLVKLNCIRAWFAPRSKRFPLHPHMHFAWCILIASLANHMLFMFAAIFRLMSSWPNYFKFGFSISLSGRDCCEEWTLYYFGSLIYDKRELVSVHAHCTRWWSDKEVNSMAVCQNLKKKNNNIRLYASMVEARRKKFQTRAEWESHYIEFRLRKCQLRTIGRHPDTTISRSKSTTCHIESITYINKRGTALSWCGWDFISEIDGRLRAARTAIVCVCVWCAPRRPSLHLPDAGLLSASSFPLYYKYVIILLFMPANPMRFHCCPTTYFLIGKTTKEKHATQPPHCLFDTVQTRIK